MSVFRKKRIAFLLFCLITAGILYFYFSMLPQIINIEKYKPTLEKEIKTSLKLPVNIGNISLSFKPDLTVEVFTDKLSVLDKTKADMISSSSIRINFFLPSLLKKNLLIKKIRLDAPILNIKRDSKGDFNLEELIPKTKKQKEFKISFDKTAIEINNYRIFFKDDYIKPAQAFSLIGESIRISDFTPDKKIRIKANGHAVTEGSKDTIFDTDFLISLPLSKHNILKKSSYKGSLKNFNAPDYLPYIKKYTNLDCNDISGLADFKFEISNSDKIIDSSKFYLEGNLDNLDIVRSCERFRIYAPGLTYIFLKGSFDKKRILFETANIKNDLLKVWMQGTVSDYKTKQKTIDLKLNIENAKAMSVANLFPKEVKVPLNSFVKILDKKINSDIQGTLSLKGYYKKPQIFGKIEFKNLSADFLPSFAPKTYGKIEFFGKSMFIDVNSFLAPKENIKTTGKIWHIDKKLDLHVKTNLIDMEKAQTVLLAVSDFFVFKTGPVPQMTMKGKGTADLTISGSFKLPEIVGNVKTENAALTYEGLYGKAHDVKGTLKFAGDRVVYDEISGYNDNQKVIPSGYSDFKGFSDVKLILPNLDFVYGIKFVNNSKLLEKIKIALKNIENVTGSADAVIKLKGTEKVLDSESEFKFNNTNLKYAGFSKPFENLSGTLKVINQKVYLSDVKGTFANSPFSVNGNVDGNNNLDLKISGSQVDLSEIKKIVRNSPLLKTADKQLAEFTAFNGKAQAILLLQGNMQSPDLLKSLQANIKDGSFSTAKFGFPVTSAEGEVTINPDSISFKNFRAKYIDQNVLLSGKISTVSSAKNNNLYVAVNNFPVEKIQKIALIPLVPKDVKEYFKSFDESRGNIDINARILPDDFILNLNFDRAYSRNIPTKMPISVDSGTLTVTSENLGFKNLSLKLSESSFFLNGKINSFKKSQFFDVNFSAVLNSKDMDTYISPNLKVPLKIVGNFNTKGYFKGNKNDWMLFGKSTLNPGDNIVFRHDMGLNLEKKRMFEYTIAKNPSRIDINQLNIYYINDSGQNTAEDSLSEKLLELKGALKNTDTASPEFENISFKAENNLPAGILNPLMPNNEKDQYFSGGSLNGSAIINGKTVSPKITGNIAFKDVVMPSASLSLNNGKIDFSSDKITISDTDISIDGTSALINAVLDNILEFPLTAEKVTLDSKSLNIDNLIEIFGQDNDNQKNLTLPPLVVTKGILNADEVIINNLINTDVKANFDLSPDWLLSVEDMTFKTAGGTLNGDVLYNIKTSELSSNLRAKDIQANAAATTLLNLSNEVYGSLEGQISFKTRGKTLDDILSNAEGDASFQIEKGRLVRLGSLEYLLRATNVIQSGIGGLNINNIIDLIVPQKTGHFETLNGTLTTKNAILKAENITSDGKNLSLDLSGNFDMLTDYADIKILGKLSKKVTGLLGPLGSISLNNFIDFIPGLGFLPSSQNGGLLRMVPGIGNIPLLGLASSKYRHFEVNIEGDLYNTKSVKSFRWLD